MSVAVLLEGRLFVEQAKAEGGGWFHCHGTRIIRVLVCMGLGLARGLGSKHYLMVALERSLVEGSRVCLLWRSSVIFVPALL
jgi:hypothetical protein